MRDPSEIVIVSAKRTPIGKFNGSLSSFSASQLSAILIKEAVSRLNLYYDHISQVILGHVLTAGQGQNPARQATLGAEMPDDIPSYSVNMVCGSGLKAVSLAYDALKCDPDTIILAGGQESMSRAPHCVSLREGIKYGDGTLYDTVLKDGLTDYFNMVHMGITAENIAAVYNVVRDAQDRYALQSQQRYKKALESNHFADEIVPVEIQGKKGAKTIVAQDEFPRPATTIADLAKLKPAFMTEEQGGTVTAGNSSGINDGAALLVLMSRSKAQELKLTPLVKIVCHVDVGIQPRIMGMSPVLAIKKAIEKSGWLLEDVDLFEINEAFAAQCIAVIDELKIPQEKVNVCGGSIAMGHPIGASGARVLVTLIHAMQRAQLKEPTKAIKGIASLCIGGGLGIAMCVETIPQSSNN